MTRPTNEARPARLRYDTDDISKARNLRNNATPAERKLWELLRQEGKLRGLHFRRQCPIHPFIADFACLKLKLIIELDGMSHDTQLTYDARRDSYLEGLGFNILRFTNDAVLGNPEGVIGTILAQAALLQAQKMS